MAEFKRQTFFFSNGKQIKLYGTGFGVARTLEITEASAPNVFWLIEGQEGGKPTTTICNPYKLTAEEIMEVADYCIRQWMDVKDNVRRFAGTGSITPKYSTGRMCGLVLHLVKNVKDTLYLRITSRGRIKASRIYLRLQIRGMVAAVAAASLTDSLLVKFPVKDIPEGIAEITLFDDRSRPRAERLVYINPDKKLHIRCRLAKNTFSPREKISLVIKTTDEKGNPVSSCLGLSVFHHLYANRKDVKDIDNHYYLSTQLKGRLYDPRYYFDTANSDRSEALDLLLLTQGWRCYTWNEEALTHRATNHEPVITNGVTGRVVQAPHVKKERKLPNGLLVFNASQTQQLLITLDSAGRFFMSPALLAIGRRIYIKHFANNPAAYETQVEYPFNVIKKAEANMEMNYPVALTATKDTSEEQQRRYDEQLATQFTKTLEPVTVTAKRTDIFKDKYMGSLDSAATLGMCTDYVGACGILNCPACGRGEKPVEGRQYSEFVGSRKDKIVSHPFSFSPDEMRKVTYHYPHYTEAELLKMFNLSVVKGYYTHKAFYEPDYDKEKDATPDFRNTLAWMPDIITDQHGEATVIFYCADIPGYFSAKIEGVSQEGLIGKQQFTIKVLQPK